MSRFTGIVMNGGTLGSLHTFVEKGASVTFVTAQPTEAPTSTTAPTAQATIIDYHHAMHNIDPSQPQDFDAFLQPLYKTPEVLRASRGPGGCSLLDVAIMHYTRMRDGDMMRRYLAEKHDVSYYVMVEKWYKIIKKLSEMGVPICAQLL